MKVAFFTDVKIVEFNENYYALNLNNELWKRYLEIFDSIDVYCRVIKSDNVKGLTIANNNSVYIKNVGSYKGMKDLILNRRKIYSELTDIIKSYDKIIVRLPTVIGLIVCNICKKYKKDYLVEMVGCPFDGYWNHSNLAGKLIAPIMYLMNKKAIKQADNVLYVTEKFLQSRYPNSNNNIGCSDVNIDDNIGYLNIKINKPIKDKIVLGTVGNVELKYKGQIYVLKILKKLLKKYKNVSYMIIGGGNNSRLLNYVKKHKLDDYVDFSGNLTHNQVIERLVDIDIYIQPSLQEGLPRAFIEAMSVGCVCIGSDAGGMYELVGGKYIFKKRCPNAVYQKIIQIIDEHKDKGYYSLSNYEFTKKFTSEENHLKRKKFYSNFRDI